MKASWIVLCFSIIFFMTGCSNGTAPVSGKTGSLEAVFFKIGKADSIFLTAGGKNVLIDTGEDDDGDEIIKYLNEKKIKKIDLLILTHYDKDHAGGADQIIKAKAIGHVVGPDYEADSKEYDEYTKALSQKGIKPELLHEDYIYKAGQTEFRIEPPKKQKYEKENDYSLVIHVEHGHKRFLFAGDAEETRLGELIEEGSLSSSLLKMPHHGKFNTKVLEFLVNVKPEYAVITCSDKNPEDPKTTAALKSLGSQVFLTRQGNIYLSSNGTDITINQ